jgi:RHS repeat-associated protein
MLSDFGLIHMNGRVYDPVLGRFLSADPYVGDAYDSQDYNRYSYVGNNPMNATDPSGYFSLKDALKIVAIVVVSYFTAGAALYLSGGITGVAAGATATFGNALAALVGTGGFGVTLGGAIAAGAGAGFASGFAGSLLNGGSIGDAFKAGIIGGAIGAVAGGLTFGIGGSNLNYFERAAAHGVVGGAVESAGGGQFRHGFYAGFATAAASPGIGMVPKQVRFIAAAIVGGTASALGGGKFANGAVTGAFQYLLNRAQHNIVEETNALKFDGSDGNTLVVRSNTEMRNLGQYWSDSDMNGPSSGRVRVLDVDLYSGTPDEILKAAKLDGLKFDNIVLERHNGPNGEGNLRMKRLFAPNSPLLSALAGQLNSGGRVWFNGCFGQQFFDSHPDYAAGLKTTFGGARVYAAPGYQAMFRYGLASQAVAPDGKVITNRFHDYKEY